MSQKTARTEEDNNVAKEALEELLAKLGDSLEHVAPEGFLKQVGDTSGTWISASPIQGIVRGAKMTDSHFDDKKPAAIILVELTRPCIVDAEGEFLVAEPGAIVGVWYKPGMRALRYLCNTEMWMRVSGTKDTGKGNPMVTFDIRSASRGGTMAILDDFRESSMPVQDANGKVIGLHDLDPRPSDQALARIPI